MKALLFVLVAAGSVFGTDRIEFERGDKTKLSGYIDKPEGTSFPIAIVLQGSQCFSVQPVHEEWKERLLKAGYAIATLEKRGISGEAIDKGEYEEYNSIDQRVSDHLLFLEKARRGEIRGWNGKVAFIGNSEGGEVAGILAAKTGEAIALVLLCAGGGWSRMEEILWSFRKQLVEESYSPQYIQSLLVKSRDELYTALENPSSKLKAFGFTYKYWSSTLKHRLLDSLIQVKCPVYIVQGALDDRIPPNSTDYLVKALESQGKEGVRYKRVENLGHDPRQDPAVFTDAVAWLENLRK